MGSTMSIAAKLDDLGKPAWIGLMILSFMAYWPAGLAVLAYLIWSGRMRSWKHGGFGRWQQAGMDHMHNARGRWCGGARRADTSGNHAFDEYRNETLRRLEDEQREFLAFLERLRQAKDKAEFDQFMSERNHPSHGPEAPAPN
jgi:uncharacterized protein DUF2852